jgi:ParD-like antitoxin of type II bacterial toxin-antitoxin system
MNAGMQYVEGVAICYSSGMADSVPIRLSAALADRARQAAKIRDRSLTEQVEHWARLGQVVEAAVLNSTIAGLKAISYDERLSRMIASADTASARRHAACSIAMKNPVRYGTSNAEPEKIRKVVST